MIDLEGLQAQQSRSVHQALLQSLMCYFDLGSERETSFNKYKGIIRL